MTDAARDHQRIVALLAERDQLLARLASPGTVHPSSMLVDALSAQSDGVSPDRAETPAAPRHRPWWRFW
jgi:hypothetical protein